jgi:hypothetical protein
LQEIYEQQTICIAINANKMTHEPVYVMGPHGNNDANSSNMESRLKELGRDAEAFKPSPSSVPMDGAATMGARRTPRAISGAPLGEGLSIGSRSLMDAGFMRLRIVPY